MTKFKVGDKVRCIGGSEAGDKGAGWEIGYEFEIVEVSNSSNPIYWKGKNGSGVYEPFIELAKKHNPKAPTHVVIWDEEDRDPNRFFTNEKEAKDFIKELSDKSNVKKESIILVEIKSAQKVNITKYVRLVNYKI